MNTWSERSLKNLAGVHPSLVGLFDYVLPHVDCTVLCGLRTLEQQRLLMSQGRTRTMNSKHLEQPDGMSHAVDVVPYPVDWGNLQRFYYFGGFVKGVALQMGIGIRWGGDWDGDSDFNDQRFNDLVHFELVQ